MLIAGPLLAKLSFASKPVKPYSDEELTGLLAARDEQPTEAPQGDMYYNGRTFPRPDLGPA